jgi:hypothetical protein
MALELAPIMSHILGAVLVSLPLLVGCTALLEGAPASPPPLDSGLAEPAHADTMARADRSGVDARADRRQAAQEGRADRVPPSPPKPAELRVSLAKLGTYGGSSSGLKMSLQSNPGPLTLRSPLEQRYFAIYFAPATVRVNGTPIVMTIADPSGAGGPAWNGGSLKYDVAAHTWVKAGSGAYLRVWHNQHLFGSCTSKSAPLTYAGKSGGPEEITCHCDADLCMVTGLSKTNPPGKDGKMVPVDSSRYRLDGTDVVVVID